MRSTVALGAAESVSLLMRKQWPAGRCKGGPFHKWKNRQSGGCMPYHDMRSRSVLVRDEGGWLHRRVGGCSGQPSRAIHDASMD